MTRIQVDISEQKLRAFCQRHRVGRLSLFGSVLRADFSPASDVDVLVEFLPDARPGLFEMARMQLELEEIFGRRVDLVSKKGLLNSPNSLRRRGILESVREIYAA